MHVLHSQCYSGLHIKELDVCHCSNQVLYVPNGIEHYVLVGLKVRVHYIFTLLGGFQHRVGSSRGGL